MLTEEGELMSLLTVELPTEIYERLNDAAAKQGKPVETMVRDWLVASVEETPATEREKLRAALRGAGLLVLESDLESAQHQPLNPDERAALAARVPPGRSLSDIIIEERGDD